MSLAVVGQRTRIRLITGPVATLVERLGIIGGN
jgi:hypothetical protein